MSRSQTTPTRGSLGLIMDPVFGPFFAGRMLAASGVWVSTIVSAIVAFQLSGSALVVGAVSVAQFGPQLFLAPLSGAAADRGGRKRQMVAGRLVVALGSGSLATAIFVLGVEGLPGAWVVVLAAGVIGVGFVIGGPAMNALIPSLVRPSELPTAMALNSLPFSVGRAGGPAIGAVIATTLGPGVALAIAASANAAFGLIVALLPIKSWTPSSGRDRSVRAGLAYVRRNSVLFGLLIGVAGVGIGADPVITLTPALSDFLGTGEAFVGIMASSFGVGAVVAIAAMTSIRRRFGLQTMGFAGLGLLSIGLIGTGVSPMPWVALVALFFGGVGMTVALTSLTTQLQQRLPEEFRGRVMGLYAVAFLGSRPVAATLNGWISDAVSPQFAFASAASVVFGIAWYVRSKTVRVPPRSPAPA